MKNTNKHSIELFTKGLAILALLVATPCVADTIYNNLGPGNTFLVNREYDTSTAILATTFTATGSGALDTVLLSAFSLDPAITFGLYANGDNAPGQLLESWNVPVPGLPGQLFTLNSALNPVLTTNTEYWFVITQTRPFQVAWYENNQGVAGGINESSSLNGPFLGFVPGSPIPALQLNSTAGGSGGSTGGTTTVPEPGSLCMFGICVAGLLLAMRMAKRSQPASA